MVKKYADLFLDARRALLKQEGQFAANVARELVCAASGKTAEQVIADREIYASEEVCELTESFVQRRLRGEPMPYILGQWDFYGMTLTVTPDVLIPRDDTVVVTELAIKKAMYLEQNPRILDLCTGSGCIGLAIARRVKDARVTLGDVSDNETVQLSMFQDEQKDRARKLDQTVDQLRSKFGVTAISRGSVTDATKRVGRKYKAQLEEDKPKQP